MGTTRIQITIKAGALTYPFLIKSDKYTPLTKRFLFFNFVWNHNSHLVCCVGKLTNQPNSRPFLNNSFVTYNWGSHGIPTILEIFVCTHKHRLTPTSLHTHTPVTTNLLQLRKQKLLKYVKEEKVMLEGNLIF